MSPLRIDFEGTFPYRKPPGYNGSMPLAEVVLHSGNNHTGTILALLDTGAIITVFQREFAIDLGIDDVTTGLIHEVVSTLGGSFTVYYFDVEMELTLNGHSNRFGCQVGFAEEHIPRNILGRNIVFQLYTFAFRERHSEVFFAQH
jgi:hypothetical protein